MQIRKLSDFSSPNDKKADNKINENQKILTNTNESAPVVRKSTGWGVIEKPAQTNILNIASITDRQQGQPSQQSQTTYNQSQQMADDLALVFPLPNLARPLIEPPFYGTNRPIPVHPGHFKHEDPDGFDRDHILISDLKLNKLDRQLLFAFQTMMCVIGGEHPVSMDACRWHKVEGDPRCSALQCRHASDVSSNNFKALTKKEKAIYLLPDIDDGYDQDRPGGMKIAKNGDIAKALHDNKKGKKQKNQVDSKQQSLFG